MFRYPEVFSSIMMMMILVLTVLIKAFHRTKVIGYKGKTLDHFYQVVELMFCNTKDVTFDFCVSYRVLPHVLFVRKLHASL